MKKVISSVLLSIALLVGVLSFASNIYALNCGSDGKCPKGYTPEVNTAGECSCINMFGGDDVESVGDAIGLSGTSMPQIIGNIIKTVLGLFGVVATVIIVTGGVKWMLSQGDTSKIDAAKKIMVAGAIGMVLIVSGYAVTAFLISSLMKTVGA